jgi:ParB-like chromosome segregation protein Spo0J
MPKTNKGPKVPSSIKIHPLANFLPRMSKKEYSELTEDIKAGGVKVPLLVSKDKSTLIDGRHRWYVAHDLGIKPEELPWEVFDGKEEEIPGIIISRNLMRRNIEDADQRVAIALQIRGDQLEKDAKQRQADKSGAFKGNGEESKRRSVAAQLAEETHVSEHKAGQALKAKKAGLLGRVAKGTMKLKEAAKQAPQSKKGKTMQKKAPTFDKKVWSRWQSWLKKWLPSEVRKVKELVKEWLNTGVTKEPTA